MPMLVYIGFLIFVLNIIITVYRNINNRVLIKLFAKEHKKCTHVFIFLIIDTEPDPDLWQTIQLICCISIYLSLTG